MKPLYYDRQGKPLSDVQEWAKRLDGEKRVAETTLEDGTWISTVWLGLDHNWGNGPPLIFETMVFPAGEGEQDYQRYATEEEAVAGHNAMVTKWAAVYSRTPAVFERRSASPARPSRFRTFLRTIFGGRSGPG